MTEAELELTAPTEPVVVNEVFLKGIKPGQQFYFSSDETEEVMTKSEGLFYVNEKGTRIKGFGMDKCIMF